MSTIPRTTNLGNQTWTTGQIARLLQVTPKTVINWIECDKLAAQRIEDGPRKVTAKALVEFMLRNKIDIPEELLYAGVIGKGGEVGVSGLKKRDKSIVQKRKKSTKTL